MAERAQYRRVRVRSGPRLHFGLIDLAGGATGRKYGGVGLAIAGPQTVVEVSPNEINTIVFAATVPQEHRDAVTTAVTRFTECWPFGVRLHVESTPPIHVGLGSKTSAICCALLACSTLAGQSVTVGDLVRASGRGGVSGIGINTIFDGGLLADCGHPPDGLPETPSSATVPTNPPLVLVRERLPEDWSVIVVVPRDAAGAAGDEEVAMFRHHTPLPRDEVLETLSIIYHRLLPAFALRDLASAGHALGAMHRVGFKARELATQNTAVRSLYHELVTALPHAAVGLSSMGPGIFVISSQNELGTTVSRLRRMCDSERFYHIETAPRNSGSKVERW